MIQLLLLPFYLLAISFTNDVKIEGEVVGYTGRIGSFLLRAKPNCVPISKDMTPGVSSPPNTPIFVSVPATQVLSGMFKKKRSDGCILFNVFLINYHFHSY